jgi:hypothetical protein
VHEHDCPNREKGTQDRKGIFLFTGIAMSSFLCHDFRLLAEGLRDRNQSDNYGHSQTVRIQF